MSSIFFYLAPLGELFPTLKIDAGSFELDGKPVKFRKIYFPSLLLILAPLRLCAKIFFWKRWACCA
jgi:hypothetical protein